MILVPLLLALLTQAWAIRSQAGVRATAFLGLLPVPATALVLFLVVSAVASQLASAVGIALSVVPIYLAFAIIAPGLGWLVARWFRLEAAPGRSIAFSAATRNSLVVLPLALAVPGAIPILPAVIVTQTLVELLSELIYVRVIAKSDCQLDGHVAEPSQADYADSAARADVPGAQGRIGGDACA